MAQGKVVEVIGIIRVVMATFALWLYLGLNTLILNDLLISFFYYSNI